MRTITDLGGKNRLATMIFFKLIIVLASFFYSVMGYGMSLAVARSNLTAAQTNLAVAQTNLAAALGAQTTAQNNFNGGNDGGAWLGTCGWGWPWVTCGDLVNCTAAGPQYGWCKDYGSGCNFHKDWPLGSNCSALKTLLDNATSNVTAATANVTSKQALVDTAQARLNAVQTLLGNAQPSCAVGSASCTLPLKPRANTDTNSKGGLSINPSQLISGTLQPNVTIGLGTSGSISGSGAIVGNNITGNTLNGALATSNLTGQVTGSQIASGAVGTAQLSDSAITTDKIAAGAVTTPKIGAGAVGSDQVSSIAVSKLACSTSWSGTSYLTPEDRWYNGDWESMGSSTVNAVGLCPGNYTLTLTMPYPNFGISSGLCGGGNCCSSLHTNTAVGDANTGHCQGQNIWINSAITVTQTVTINSMQRFDGISIAPYFQNGGSDHHRGYGRTLYLSITLQKQ